MTGRAPGFSLVETLVALVVLSLGLLGAWALLISSLAGHADAHRYAVASNLLRDMAERIRANPRAGARYTAGEDDRHDRLGNGDHARRSGLARQVTQPDLYLGQRRG